jgi:hypothetical protein
MPIAQEGAEDDGLSARRYQWPALDRANSIRFQRLVFTLSGNAGKGGLDGKK